MRERITTGNPHPHKALTARTVATASEPGRYADGGGLYLLVAPGGSKSWVLRTVVKGKRSDIGLGSVALVSLADAREDARTLRKVARGGGDPLAARRQDRKIVPIFEEAAKEVHKAHAAGFKNKKHQKQWLSSLKGVFSTFGAKRVDSIGSADILAALSSGWLKRPETSRRILQRVRVIFDWCKAQGFCQGDNPTEGITDVLPKHRGVQAHHAALPFQQLPAFLQALRESDSGEAVKLAFEFTILCASRTSETLNATWAEINIDAKTWTIPAARMKAGEEHRVPLSPGSIKVLRKAQEVADGGKYVFPGRSKGKPLSNMVFLMTLRRMGQREVTAHGFRSTFRDWASERTNFPRAVCEAALAHTLRDKTEAAYNRSDLFDRRRDLMESWSRFATAKPANVISIRA